MVARIAAPPPGGVGGEIEAALEALRPRVVAAVRRACPAWLACQADDVVQEVLARLLTYLRRDEGNRTFSSIYLEKAAYGALVDEIRRQTRRREDPVGDPSTMEATPARVIGPEGAAAGREIGRGIRDCLVRLDRPRRLAVTLYLQGCSVPETARRLGWPGKRAENLVYRGLADLRTCLRRKGMAP